MSEHDVERREEALERRTREVFEASVEQLDAGTRASLRTARQAAIAELEARQRPGWRGWVPMAVATSAALLAVLLWRAPADSPMPVASSGVTEAIDVLEVAAAGDDLDLVAEDLEFYVWLEQTELDRQDAPNGGQG
jgi:hypothetical protein